MTLRTLSLLLLALFGSISSLFSASPTRWAVLSDTHINAKDSTTIDDLKRCIEDINQTDSISFVLVAGDITEYGDSLSMAIAKSCLSQLLPKYYVVPGNHDVDRKDVGNTALFRKIFGDDRFHFQDEALSVIGFPTLPHGQWGKGSVAENHQSWLSQIVAKETTICRIGLTHYPLIGGDILHSDSLIAQLKKCGVKIVISGHYHRNAIFDYDGILGVVCRSTLRGKQPNGGYTLFSLDDQFLVVSEKEIGGRLTAWFQLPITVLRIDNHLKK